VPFAFFASSIYLIIFLGYDPSFLLPYGADEIQSSILLAIPLFIMAGGIIETGGMGKRIINLVNSIVGKLKGGLGIATIVSCAIFGSISGSGSATMTTIGNIMLPRLEESGYPRGYSASLVASASVLGSFIPPSSLMILYGWISNQSVLAAFLSTVIPGIIFMILLSIITIFYLKNIEIKTVGPIDFKTRTKHIGKNTLSSLPVLILAFIVLGGIYGGFMTTTEAAGVSVIYSIPVGIWITKGLNGKNFYQVVVKSATMTGIIMLMLFASMILSRMLVTEHLPEKMTDLLLVISDNKIIILLLVNLVLVVIGMLMDDVSGVLLTTPILLPIVMDFGVDPIHFAAILSVNLGLGVVTPPSAPLLFLAGQLAGAKPIELFKPTAIIIAFAWLPVLAITTYFPELSLFLPKLLLDY